MGDRFAKRFARKPRAQGKSLPVSELPAPFPDVLRAQGIEALYPPQAEAVPHLFAGKNLVLSVPTASGKSLVAYLAILNNFLKKGAAGSGASGAPGGPSGLRRGGKSLYIVPLRALAAEKYQELRAFKDLGLRVGIATGDLDQADARLGQFDCVVCTSEKADSLLRHQSSWLSELSVVVADEVHLIHDPSRGPTLEVILARFRALNPGAQIVALSATIANAKELAAWLDAELVLSEWRPVELREGVLFGNRLTFTDGTEKEIEGGARDAVAALVADTIRGGGQCLVFCNTRKGAEALAAKLGPTVARLLGDEEKARLQELAAKLDGDDGEASLTGARLSESVKRGSAFHNAGLGNAHRTLVEENFKLGLIKVICATPTLAAGVNIPARRVIVRDLWRYEANMGNQPIPVLEVKQMMGRAGRPRYDPWGEAVLLAKTREERDAVREMYLEAGAEPVTSKLGAESALRVHILAAIATGFVSSRQGIDDFVGSTFYAQQASVGSLRDQIDATLEFLARGDFVEPRDGGRLLPTRFGRRTSDLYIDPLSALRLRDALLAAKTRSASVLAWLHAASSTPDMMPLYLRRGDDWVEEKAAQNESELLLPPSPLRDYEEFLAEFKTAWLLLDWINETPLEPVEERYGIGPGDVHNRVQVGEWLLYAAKELAPLFNPDAQAQLSRLVLRVQAGCKEDLLPLIALRGIGRFRARVLATHGFRTLDSLRTGDPRALTRLPGFGPRLVASLKKQLGVAVEVAAKGQVEEEPIRGELSEEEIEVRLKRKSGQKSLLDWGAT